MTASEEGSAGLQVIGAGFSRTGTDSLRTALIRLGYKVHHMKEFLTNTNALDFQEAYLHPERPVDWGSLYDGYTAACDVPTICLLDRLLKDFPNVKVILTERDPESWYNSVKTTIWPIQFKVKEVEGVPQNLLDSQTMAGTIFLDGDYGSDKFLDKEAMKAKFVKHYEWVKANVPPERLLVFKLGEANYKDLCAFLGKDEIDEPYPKTNSAAELRELADKIFKPAESKEQQPQ